MRRFRFRLEKLLILRRHAEKEWEIKLAEITGICIKLEKGMIKAESEKTRVLMELKAGRGMVDMEILRYREQYTGRLNHRLRELEDELVKKRIELEKIRKKYIEVSRDRKVIGKLKDRREAEYYKNLKLEEIKIMDDINVKKKYIN
ncbi:MAG: flagellar export protein FliJ [Spirochaetes bacterium]|nr:flagellar export protein FliJ [Spirochaetota bacterium]